MYSSNNHSIHAKAIISESYLMLPLAQIPKKTFPASQFDALTKKTSYWEPAVDIFEDAQQFVIQTELPGIDPDTVEIEIDEKAITIKGSKRSTTFYERLQCRDIREADSFTRFIALPARIDANGVKQHYENGVLTVYLPKDRPSTMKTIDILFVR